VQKVINVLHVLNSAHGGSALSTFQLIEALKKHGVRSSLVCFNNASAELKSAITRQVEGRVLFIPLYWTNKRTRVAWWKRPLLESLTVWQTWWGHKYQKQISNLIRANQIDVIHTSTIVNREGAIAAKRNRLPHVWHVRELIGGNTYYNFPRFRSWVSFVEKHADFLIANSQATAQNLKLYFPQSKIKCIPNGIDPTGYNIKRHQDKEKLVIAMVGNVTSRLKNHEFFIETVSFLKNKPHVAFRIYGALPSETDPYYRGLKSQIDQNGLAEILTFKGHQQSEVIMADIDILFHPMGQESFGRIFIEAMAGGIPIVSVDNGGAVELVRNDVNGFRVPENDAPAAASALEKMLNSTELRSRLGRNGRDIVEKEYTLELLAQNLSSVYKSLI
jgi:glycosyltransferase involved in cell wall biosynthesis